MPLSFSGFGPAAILIMLLCLGAKKLFDFLRAKYHRPDKPSGIL
jgi:hypothetical protein